MQSLEALPRSKKEQIAQIFAEQARRHLLPFCRFQFSDYQTPDHIRLIAEHLEAVERGEIKKLMIFVPPRCGKSELASTRFPAWYLGRNPGKRIIHSSYSSTLSCSFSRKSRNLIEDPRYQFIFPDVKLSADSHAVDNWEIDGTGGGFIASGVGGSITGFGADVFIIDDPVKNLEEAESEVFREKTWEWYQSVARTRMEPGAAQILIMTRWHRQDLAGKILDTQKDWTIINLPALSEHGDVIPGTDGTVVDPLGREKDKALWPERYNEEALTLIKNDVGSRVWFALYQGRPQDPAGQKFKREWFQFYDTLPSEVQYGGGIDTATSSKSSADNMAMVTVCKDKAKTLYVEDILCDKMSVAAFAKHVCNLQAVHAYLSINLDSNAAGEAIKQRIGEEARECGSCPPVHAKATSTDKMVRAMEFQHLIENGTIKFKRGNPKVAALIEHLINFDGKGSDIDDDVDALGFAIKAVYGSGPRFFAL
jgi:predicted phage terminase large subunit-like protein